MQNLKRVVHAPADRSVEAVRQKPKPPDDLWQQLGTLAADHGMHGIVEAKPDYIWASEWARRDGMATSTASTRLRRLQKAGLLEYVGMGVNNVKYYRFKK